MLKKGERFFLLMYDNICFLIVIDIDLYIEKLVIPIINNRQEHEEIGLTRLVYIM